MPKNIYVARVTDIVAYRVRTPDGVLLADVPVTNPPAADTARTAAKAVKAANPGSKIYRDKTVLAFRVKNRDTGATLATVNVTPGGGVGGVNAARAAAFTVRNTLAPGGQALA